ncbi:hypothetical protein A5784_30840 [Mycobacterium sp. 852013-50091_SCH5140682]|uniref:hypothetical protein n=1 Tax=Mycobacterium sp. 852013-50091_SCH5140682 TaxID=1834109 RepID=UPI0007EB8DF6|nr:hypothetical protein [Mycobacterium sp. 852013-50091_SCH5140682]OBC14098.1 hypothetical protein A5784_30840 [Mycobacterium sp. 852013-50091_SCH5140682]
MSTCITGLGMAIEAHNRPFSGAAQRRNGLSATQAPLPDTYDAAIAELQATREELADVLAEHDNFAPLLRFAHEANTVMAREMSELIADREQIRDERDELRVRVDELTTENEDLLERVEFLGKEPVEGRRGAAAVAP